MKKSTIKKAVAIWLLMMVGSMLSFAQTDSLTIETEMISDHGHYYKRKYQYIDLNLGDESRLLKLAIQPFKPNENYNFVVLSLQAAYEKKLNRSFSLVSEINSSTIWVTELSLATTGLSIGTRWYPGKNKKIDKGMSGNNCNGYYAGFKAKNIVRAMAIKDKNTNGIFNRHVDLNPVPEINLGLQQRVSNLFYVDVNAFVNYDFIIEQKLGYGVMVLLGISINAED